MLIIGVHKKDIILSFARVNSNGFVDLRNISRQHVFDVNKIIEICSKLPKADAVLAYPDKVKFICEYVRDEAYGVRSYLVELPGQIKELIVLLQEYEEIYTWFQ